MSLQVRFTFSDELLEKNGFKRESVYYTIKENYEKKGIVCISDDDVLAFEDTGKKDDYANIWNTIMSLIAGDWFYKCVSSCDFIENGDVEDVYAQIPKLRKKMSELDLSVLYEMGRED